MGNISGAEFLLAGCSAGGRGVMAALDGVRHRRPEGHAAHTRLEGTH